MFQCQHVNVILEYFDHCYHHKYGDILKGFCYLEAFLFKHIFLLTTFLQSDHTVMSLGTNKCNIQIFIYFKNILHRILLVNTVATINFRCGD